MWRIIRKHGNPCSLEITYFFSASYANMAHECLINVWEYSTVRDQIFKCLLWEALPQMCLRLWVVEEAIACRSLRYPTVDISWGKSVGNQDPTDDVSISKRPWGERLSDFRGIDLIKMVRGIGYRGNQSIQLVYPSGPNVLRRSTRQLLLPSLFLHYEYCVLHQE